MSGKILNSLRINSSIKQIGNVGVPKLVWRHVEVDGVYQFRIVLLMAAEGRGNCVLNALAVDILIIVAGLGSPDSHILPNPLKLRIRKRLPLAICYHIFGYGFLFNFPQQVYQTFGNGNIPAGRFGF